MGYDPETIALVNLAISGFSFLTVVVYTLITWKISNETSLMRKQQANPRVVVDFNYSKMNYSQYINIYIHNVGGGPAYDVTASYSLNRGNNDHVSDKVADSLGKMGIFSNVIKFMNVDKKLTMRLVSISEFSDVFGLSLVVDMKYENVAGDKLATTSTINFDLLGGVVNEPF